MNKSNNLAKKTVLIVAILLLLLNVNNQTNAEKEKENTKIELEQSPILVISHKTTIVFLNQKEIFIDESLYFEIQQNTSISYLDFWFNQSYKNDSLKINDEIGSLDFSESNTSDLVTIYLRSMLHQNQTSFLRFRYILGYGPLPIDSNPPYYLFSYECCISFETEEYTIELRLPRFSFIYEDENIPDSIYPEEDDINIVDNSIFIFWLFEELEPYSCQLISVFYEDLPPGSSNIWALVVGPILGIIVGAIGVFYFMRRRESRIYDELEKVFITENQKILLKYIDEKDGKTTQKELIELTGFTKSKISRNLSPLEEKNLILREKWGREYKVYLTANGKRLIKKIVVKEFPDTFNETQTDLSKGEEQI